MVLIKLLIFASLRDTFQEQRELVLDIEQAEWKSVTDLKLKLIEILQVRWLQRNHETENIYNENLQSIGINIPTFNHRSIMLAVNTNFIHTNDAINLRENDKVAMIPPVSGG